MPRHAQNSHCAFSSIFILTPEGKLQALSNRAQGRVCSQCAGVSPEESSRQFMRSHWGFNESYQIDGEDSFYNRLLNYSLTISCMPFQDVWSIDLDRLRGCCRHMGIPGRRVIPFCAYYLTSAGGERLYSSPLGEVRASK